MSPSDHTNAVRLAARRVKQEAKTEQPATFCMREGIWRAPTRGDWWPRTAAKLPLSTDVADGSLQDLLSGPPERRLKGELPCHR
jgi:hypothetical protein